MYVGTKASKGFHMCTGAKTKPPAMETTSPRSFSELLEHAASDDVEAFTSASKAKEDTMINSQSVWYGRKIGSKKMSCEERTPAMIAAMFGSKSVLRYLLAAARLDVVSAVSASDGATALHCAAAGGSAAAAEVVELLLAAGADASALDSSGRRAADLVAPVSPPRRMTAAAVERREFCSDATLFDMKNGIYGTDEFRMYCFKVKPCSRAYSHDWTECPFVHPGENARRRDPRRFNYSCVPCPEYRKGMCRNGDSCEYSHGIFECWLHPAQYRTRLCKDVSSCLRPVCFFAHHPLQLRPLHPSTGSAIGIHPIHHSSTAFACRSRSFVERGFASLPNPHWGSDSSSGSGSGSGSTPEGSPDWGVSGDSNRFRKSASFGVRSGGGSGGGCYYEEPDVSWVQSLVVEPQRFDENMMLPAWIEQMYIDQEQLVT